MVIPKHIVQYILKLKPEWNEYVKFDGTIIVKLNKAIYGTAEGANRWNDHINTTLTNNCKFKRSNIDPCLYYHINGDKITMIVVHVDDILMASNDSTFRDSVVAELTQQYGVLKHQVGNDLDYLNSKIIISEQGKVINFHQNNYTNKLLTEYDINKISNWPSSNNILEKYQPDDVPLLNKAEASIYRQLTMELMYLAVHTRYDILNSVAILSKKCSNPNELDMKNAYRILYYLNKFPTLGLTFRKCNVINDINIDIYADASYGQMINSKSITGYFMRLCPHSSPIYSRCITQKFITRSSTDAEVAAADDALLMGIKIYDMLKELRMSCYINMHQDNMSAITLGKQGAKMSHGRSGCMVIKINGYKELLDQYKVNLKYIDTEHMIADMLTKPITGKRFKTLCDQLLMN